MVSSLGALQKALVIDLPAERISSKEAGKQCHEVFKALPKKVREDFIEKYNIGPREEFQEESIRKELLKFINSITSNDDRVRSLEKMSPPDQSKRSSSSSNSNTHGSATKSNRVVTPVKDVCLGCKQIWHPLIHHTVFKEKTHAAKREFLALNKLCYKCFASGYHKDSCTAKLRQQSSYIDASAARGRKLHCKD